MKIRCPKCKTVAKIDAAKIPPQGARVRCPKCKTRFLLKRKVNPGDRALPPTRKDPSKRPLKRASKACQSCRTIMDADAVIHFFGGRLLCEKCYRSAKESALKGQAAEATDMVQGGPMDLSFLPEPDPARPPVRTMKIKPAIVSVIAIVGIFILTWIYVYHSSMGTQPEQIYGEPIYQDGDPYYLERAYDFAREIVVGEQRVPYRAMWPSADPIEDYVQYIGEQRYEVQSWYEFSINQERLFRQHYVMLLKRVGDTWENEGASFHSGQM